jgi:RNA polymerase sigma-70 factor, ECF subfamily
MAATSNNWQTITGLLRKSSGGDLDARSQLFESVYQDLHRIAMRVFGGEQNGAGQMLQPTALLHEAFVKLSAGATVEYQDRLHFFAVAARQMRRILVDQARRRKADKRGGDRFNTTITILGELAGSQQQPAPVNLIDLNDALDELAELDDRTAKVVDLRFFGGLTEEETAQVLDVSPATVRSDWRFAKGWLIDRLQSGTQ